MEAGINPDHALWVASRFLDHKNVNQSDCGDNQQGQGEVKFMGHNTCAITLFDEGLPTPAVESRREYKPLKASWPSQLIADDSEYV